MNQNNSGISALLTQMANPIITPGPSIKHTSASSALVRTKSLKFRSGNARNLPALPGVTETPQYDPTGTLLAVLFAFCFACLFIWGCRALKKYSQSRLDVEKAIVPGAFDKKRDWSAKSAEEDRSNEVVA